MGLKSWLMCALLAAFWTLGITACRCNNSCTPGRVESCPCSVGGLGVQTCLESNTYGPCECLGDAGPGDAGPEPDASDDAPVDLDAPSDLDAPVDPDAPGDVDAASDLDAPLPADV